MPPVVDVRDDAEVDDVPAVVRRRLDDVVLRVRVGRLDDELRREDAVVAHRLVVAAVLRQLAVLRRVLREQRRGALRAVRAVRRIAEERRVEVVVRVQVVGGLRGVRRDLALPVDAALREERELEVAVGVLVVRRLERPGLPARIDRAEEEQLVLHDRPAERHAHVAEVRAERLHGAVRRLELLPVALGAAAGGCSRSRCPAACSCRSW